ncbi:MAG: CHASE domain-containing protein [Maribacter sp.]|nr:CHASE domain-containing protein [Maribacter sp.]
MYNSQLIKYGIILLAGSLLSAYMFYAINDKYRARNNATIETAIFKVELKLTRELEKINLAIESMAVFFQNTDEVSQDLFVEFTSPFVDDLYGVRFLAWAKKSEALEIQEVPLAKSKSGNFIPIPSTNGTVTSKNENTYRYVTRLIHPMPDNQDILGYNLYSDQIAAAIDNTISTRKIAYSDPVYLVQGSQRPLGFIPILVVMDSTERNPIGIVLGEFEMDKLIDKTLEFELPILNLAIRDTLFNATPYYDTIDTKAIMDDEPLDKIAIKIANRNWEVSILPQAQLTAYPHALESYFALLLGLASTLLLIIVVRQRDRYQNDLIQEVALRTAELEESNKLKENLLREIHHRVKNNLQITSSLINLQKRKLTDKETIQALESSQGRISAIALIHQKIYQDEGAKAVDLKGYLVDLINSHKNISPAVRYEISCPKISIDLDTAVPIAIITSELVINAFKHAFSNENEAALLKITVTVLEDDHINLTISDNGKGLPKYFEITKTQGLGFEIIQKLCRQIGGKFSFRTSEAGTDFTLVFKQRIPT